MNVAIKQFNQVAECTGSYMQLKATTYFKIGSKRISSREFRIYELSDQVSNESVEKSL